MNASAGQGELPQRSDVVYNGKTDVGAFCWIMWIDGEVIANVKDDFRR